MIDTQLLSFFVLAVASIASAIGVISFRNAVHSALPWQRGIAATLGLILVGALSYLLFTGTAIDASAKASGGNRLSLVVTSQGDTQAFGLALFHGFAFPFEVTSLLIVVAILGAMVLGRKG